MLAQLKNLTNQLTTPSLLLGDFNGQSITWGSHTTNNFGGVLEDLIDDLDLCLMNDGNSTLLSPSGSQTSIIDLAICTLADTYGSNRFHLLLSLNINYISNASNTNYTIASPVCNLKKANRPLYYDTCASDSKNLLDNGSTNDKHKLLCDIVHEAWEETNTVLLCGGIKNKGKWRETQKSNI